MAMEWPSVAKCYVVKILKLGPIHKHKQHGEIIKLLFGGFKERKYAKNKKGYSDIGSCTI